MKTTKKQIHAQFLGKNDSTFTSEEIKVIWGYFQVYFRNVAIEEKYADILSFDEFLNRISNDIGLTTEQIKNALSQLEGLEKKEFIECEKIIKSSAKIFKTAKAIIEKHGDTNLPS
jgi:hypothetical protein